MKTILYIACSIDWYIAKPDGDSDWVSELDVKIFDQMIQDCGWIVVGNNTFKQYEWELYPVEWVCNIIVSKSWGKDSENTLYAKSVSEALDIASEKWLEQVLLVWGWIVNGSFLQENQIHEIIMSVHPLILGKGIQIFEKDTTEKHLQLIGTKTIWDELVHIKYKVK